MENTENMGSNCEATCNATTRSLNKLDNAVCINAIFGKKKISVHILSSPRVIQERFLVKSRLNGACKLLKLTLSIYCC